MTTAHFGESIASGFAVVPAVLAPSAIESIAVIVRSGALQRSRAGARHLMSHAAVNRVAHDPRLIAIARWFVGAEPIPFRATLFDKSPRNNWLVTWHQDVALPLRERQKIPGWGPWSVKAGMTYAHAPASALSRIIALRVHIDDSRADNGPLRVLPGTHTFGVLSNAEIGRVARDIEPVECTAPIGGIVAMPRFSYIRPRRPKRSIRAGCCTSSTPTRSVSGMASSWRLPESSVGLRPRPRIPVVFVRPSRGCLTRAARRRRQGPEAARMRAVGAERRALYADEHSTRIEGVMAGVIHAQHLP